MTTIPHTPTATLLTQTSASLEAILGGPQVSPTPGRPPGRYEPRALIGVGGSGEVVLSLDRSMGFERWVCVKRLTARWFGPRGVQMLREEARILSKVQHSNVVSLLDFVNDEVPFLVLEYVDGCSLRQLMTRIAEANWPIAGYLPDSVAVYVACCLLRALSAVSRAAPGLVHRDISPHNVLLSREGEVKLSDFGIALAKDRGRWTRPSVVKGRPAYMSPEQAQNGDVDSRSDMFSVGVLLFELLSRRKPWNDGDLEHRGAGMARRGVPLTTIRSHIKPALAEAVQWLLRESAEDRPRSPDDALRLLAPHSAGDLGPMRLAAILNAVSV